MGSLLNSFKITKLDLENQNPTGFINKLDTITKYNSRFITGTPTTTASPGPVKPFLQSYGPLNQYLDLKLDNLKSTTANSNLDVEDRTPNGGIPYKIDKDFTSPKSPLATGGVRLGNQSAFTKFNQIYTPNSTYLSTNPILGNGLLQSTIKDTNLDNTDPYKITSDPTKYPATVTGTPTTSASPGPTSKFNPVYTPTNTYLPANGVRISKLQSTTANTNLDVTNGTPGGGIPYKQDKDPTSPKSSLVTGTPTTSANPGAPKKFNQIYTPESTYLDKNPIKGTGRLKSTVANTNLDIENPTPNGGIPYKVINDPTQYPADVTGTPTAKTNPGAPKKFYHRFLPTNKYAQSIKSIPERSNFLNLGSSGIDPVTENPLPPYNIFDVTDLDIEKEGVNGGIPYKQYKDPTIYPVLVQKSTSIKGYFATPGKYAEKFNQIYTPKKGETYLDFIEPYAASRFTGITTFGPGSSGGGSVDRPRPRPGLIILP